MNRNCRASGHIREATRASDCFRRRTAQFAGFATTRTACAIFRRKTVSLELLFTQVCLTFQVAGAHASCFGLHLRSTPSCCSDHTPKKSCPQHLHVSLFGLRAYRTRRRSENNPECPCASPTTLSHPLRGLVSLFTLCC